MGRRRWKQYQDTLYSGTRSSESQPHHRLYPALSSSCNPIPGSLDQIGPQLHHPASTSLPSTVLTTATTTTTTTATTGVVKQESLQRHHLQNHHHHLSAPVQDHLQQEDSRRLRPGEIKIETADEEATDGAAREDTSTRTTDTTSATATATAGVTITTVTATTTGIATTASTTTTATGTTTIATRRRRGRRQNDGEDVDGEEDGDENDEETGQGQNEAEKRLKLDENADRSAVSPLRTENDRATRDHPTANATDTEGTKVSLKKKSAMYNNNLRHYLKNN
ncbi:hypothetical protein P5V15_005577 [Pogonomyrmex californicus]